MALKSPSQHRLAAACMRLAVLLAGAALLVGCATGPVADHIPTAIGGLPEATPARPQTPGEYPAVNDLPPPRDSTVLTSEEQKKLEDELIAARARTAGASGKPAGSTRNP
jgi:hypothetical protein